MYGDDEDMRGKVPKEAGRMQKTHIIDRTNEMMNLFKAVRLRLLPLGDRIGDIDIDVVLCCRRSNPAGSPRTCAPPATSTHSCRLLGCGGSRVGISTNDHRDHHDDSDYLPVHR